eukprot:4954515-Pleurochrysis_carterae.AAC.2
MNEAAPVARSKASEAPIWTGWSHRRARPRLGYSALTPFHSETAYAQSTCRVVTLKTMILHEGPLLELRSASL